MTNFDYEILTAEKPKGVTLEQAREAIVSQYPDHHVIVEDAGDEFVATLARKSKVSRTVVAADDDALGLLDSAPPAPGKKKDEEDSEEAPEPEDEKELKDELKDDDSDDKPKDEKKDDGDEKGDEGEDDLGKAKDVLKALEKVLPKLKELLGVSDGDDLGLGDDEIHTPLKPDAEGLGPLGPGGPPHGAPPGPIGPTPGAPPEDALGGPPGGLGGPPRPPRRPPVPTGRPPARGPGVGVPAFSKRRNKVVFRPLANEDGSEVTIDQATAEILDHPKYAGYEVVNVKKDENHYVAHLKLREE